MRFRILGPLEVLHEGDRIPLSGRKAKALARLLLEPGRWIPAHRFAEVLWDDEPPSTSVRQVQNTLAALRRLLAAHGGDPIERSGFGYRLRCDEIDLVHFERDVARSRKAMREADPGAAAELLTGALGLWRGSALADLGGDRIEAAAARLEQQRLAAMEALNDAELALGRDGPSAYRAREMLDSDPYNQRAAAQLMRALHGQGRGVEALEVYTEVRTRLSEELGLDPDSGLCEAQRTVLGVEPGPRAPHTPPVPVPAQLPPGVSGFCGRDIDLKRLDDLFEPPADTLPIAVVCGPGGVGKTALAIEWAQRARDSFPDGQLYVDLRGFDPSGSVLGPSEALRGFLAALGVGAAEIPSSVKARTDMYRTYVAERRMLVVLDNAYDAEQVHPLLPGVASCRVLVTSRRVLPGLTVRHGASQMRLNVLGNVDARKLLGRRLGEVRAMAEPESVESIVRACGGLPLALAIVAARAVAEPHLPLGTIAERLREPDGALDAFDSGDPLGDVRTVFSWSYRALSPDAARLFALTGLHPGPDFSTAAAASLLAVPPRRARELLQELTGVHLLTENAPGRYSSHDLLAAYARDRLASDESESDQAMARRRLLGHYAGSASGASSKIDSYRDGQMVPRPELGAVVEEFDSAEAGREWVLAEAEVLVNMVEYTECAGFGEYAVSLARSIAGTLYRNGDWDIGLATQRRALRAARRLGDHRHEATAHLHTGMFLFACDEFDRAERQLREGLDLCDPQHDMNLMARIEYRFAVHLDEVGRIGEALDHCRAALRLFAESGDANGQANALNGIGWFHAKLGQYTDAFEYCGMSLSLCREIGEEGVEASALDTIGYLCHLQGHHRDAVEHYLRALELSRKHGLRSTEVQVDEHLGDVYRAMGEPGPARDHWQRALAVFEGASEHHAERLRSKLADLGNAAE